MGRARCGEKRQCLIAQAFHAPESFNVVKIERANRSASPMRSNCKRLRWRGAGFRPSCNKSFGAHRDDRDSVATGLVAHHAQAKAGRQNIDRQRVRAYSPPNVLDVDRTDR